MDRGILALNSGSSSLKFALYREVDAAFTLASSGEIEAMMTKPAFAAHDAKGAALAKHAWDGPIDPETGFRFVLAFVDKTFADIKIVAAGHRLVQDCTRYHGPALVNDEALTYLDGLSMLEPQHQPPEVEGIRAIKRIHPDLSQVAVFDTSFHRSMPQIAQLYAVPKSVRDVGVRQWRYHGTSYDYITGRCRNTTTTPGA